MFEGLMQKLGYVRQEDLELLNEMLEEEKARSREELDQRDARIKAFDEEVKALRKANTVLELSNDKLLKKIDELTQENRKAVDALKEAEDNATKIKKLMEKKFSALDKHVEKLALALRKSEAARKAAEKKAVVFERKLKATARQAVRQKPQKPAKARKPAGKAKKQVEKAGAGRKR